MLATWPSVLSNYAKHYETGETIPAEMIEKIERLAGEDAVRSAAEARANRTYAGRRVRAQKTSARLSAAGMAELLRQVDAWFRPTAKRWLGALTLDSMRLTELGAAVLAVQLPPSRIIELNLRGCGLGSEGVIALAAQLPRCPVLTTLDLTINDIRDEGAAALGKALEVNSVLTDLNLLEID